MSLGCIRLVNAVHLLRCSSGFLDATSTEVFGDRKADEDEGWLQQPLAAALGAPSRKGPPPPTPATTCGHCGSDIGEGAPGLLAHLRTPGLPMRSQEGLRSGHWLQLSALFLLSSVASSSRGGLGMGQFYKQGSRSVWVTQEAG